MVLLRTSANAWRRARSLAASRALSDTYYHLLENPAARHIDRCAEELPHDTPSFSKRVYQNSRGRRFFSRRDAYRDWLTVGRRLGLDFNEGMNTLLKVVLKVKDEAYLLPRWMDYYGRLVGWHNIVVVDCGSTDEEYLDLLETYKDRVLVLSYPQYYDNIHGVSSNLAFYELLSKNCKYVCVVDADEFVFGYHDGTIGRDNVLKILRNGDDPVYPGIWYPNVSVPEERSEGGMWTEPLRFSISQLSLIRGTVGGKAMIRSDRCIELGNVGHNLHVTAVASLVRPAVCGRIGVLHVSHLGPIHAEARILAHLKAKGIVPSDMPYEAVDAFLAGVIAQGQLEGASLSYARGFRQKGYDAIEPGPTFETALITGPGCEPNPDFQRHIEAFDFASVLPSRSGS